MNKLIQYASLRVTPFFPYQKRHIMIFNPLTNTLAYAMPCPKANNPANSRYQWPTQKSK